MGSQENFALRWNDFHANITSSFKHLRSSPDFQDVTLMCGIDTEIRAHKVILSACSPYFQSILCHIASPNPVVVMPHDVQYEEVVRLVDFMYHGEVAIPSQDINRFLSVAEQFQVRGLVENIPKVAPAAAGAPVPGGPKFSGKNPAKRPRVVKEDLTSDEDYDGSYQPIAPESGPTMVGLVCPKCRTMCRGVAALKTHMAVCPEQQMQCEICDATLQNQRALDAHMKKDHYRPVGQVAPAQRSRGMMNKPPGVQNFPKLANNPSLGISKVGGTPKAETVTAGTSMFNPRSARRSSNTGGSSRQSPVGTPATTTTQGRAGKVRGKPDLREIGQKLGLAVSITSVASNSPRKGGAVPEQTAQAEANAEHIKEEPTEIEENEVVEEVGEEGQEYVDEEYNQEGDGYEGEVVEGYEEGGEMEEGEYGEGEEGYAGYDDYGGGQHGQGEGSGQMFKKFQDK
eukprot:GFUD01000415.1.p1 GENE.GFUD01000415.1~~GFUD01000415.1.p1  ORF type:complete len:486 (+),score=152.93 GFUD01000415.1:91-1458(+)